MSKLTKVLLGAFIIQSVVLAGVLAESRAKPNVLFHNGEIHTTPATNDPSLTNTQQPLMEPHEGHTPTTQAEVCTTTAAPMSTPRLASQSGTINGITVHDTWTTYDARDFAGTDNNDLLAPSSKYGTVNIDARGGDDQIVIDGSQVYTNATGGGGMDTWFINRGAWHANLNDIELGEPVYITPDVPFAVAFDPVNNAVWVSEINGTPHRALKLTANSGSAAFIMDQIRYENLPVPGHTSWIDGPEGFAVGSTGGGHAH